MSTANLTWMGLGMYLAPRGVLTGDWSPRPWHGV